MPRSTQGQTVIARCQSGPFTITGEEAGPDYGYGNPTTFTRHTTLH